MDAAPITTITAIAIVKPQGKNWTKNHRPAAIKARGIYYEKNKERIKQRFRDRYIQIKQANLTTVPAVTTTGISCTCCCTCGANKKI